MLTPNSKGFVKNAIYLSHTSIKDFLSCPAAYYLKNLYRDPITGHKLQVASPHLTLGIAVHNTIDWFCSQDPKPSKEQTIQKYRQIWKNYRLKRGGFETLEEEASYGKRGLQMIENFYNHYTALDPCQACVKFPKYHLLEDVILIGNMDYIGLRSDGSFSVVDFKTGVHDEISPLQLVIYAILTEANMGKEVTEAGFWYLDRDDLPKPVVLDPVQQTLDYLIDVAKQVKLAIQQNEWVCRRDPGLCKSCREYRSLLEKKGEFLYSDTAFKKDIYFLSTQPLIASDNLAPVEGFGMDGMSDSVVVAEVAEA